MKAHYRARPYGDVRLVDGLDRPDEAQAAVPDGWVRCGCGTPVKRRGRSRVLVVQHKTPEGRRCPQRRVLDESLRVTVDTLPPIVFRGRPIMSSDDLAAAEHESRSEASRRGHAARQQPLPDPAAPLPPSSDPQYGRALRQQRAWLAHRGDPPPPPDHGRRAVTSPRPSPTGTCHDCGMRVTGERLYCGPCMVDRNGTR